MPEDNENLIEKVEKEVKSEPWYVWAGAAAAAGLVFYYVWKSRQASSSASTSAGASTSANSSDATNGISQGDIAGLPYGDLSSGYDYLSGPVGNYPSGSYNEVGVNGNQVPIVPYGDTPVYDGNGNLIGWQTPNPNQPTSPNPPPTQTQLPPPPTTTPTETGIIRALETSGQTSGYDKANPGGVPFRSTPGGAVLSEAPYGSQVSITGAPVQGSDNFGSDPNHVGSTLWFPVTLNGQNGYISAYDIVNVITGGAASPVQMHPLSTSGVGGGGFHLPINKGRNTMDQWTFANGMHQDFDSYSSEVN